MMKPIELYYIIPNELRVSSMIGLVEMAQIRVHLLNRKLFAIQVLLILCHRNKPRNIKLKKEIEETDTSLKTKSKISSILCNWDTCFHFFLIFNG